MEEMEVESRRDVRIERMTVHAMAIHEGMGKLIVSRKNNLPMASDILEQYNILCGWLCVHEKVICPDSGGIESVCFVGERIFCTHLNGSVTIADPHSDSMKRQQICPTTLWSSCAIDDSRAALVSHSATLYIFGLNEFSVLSTLSLGVDQRLFCVCSLNNLVAVGAVDNIFVVKNNIVVHNLVVARKEKRLPTIVWSCCFFNDIILASGDSRGIVSLWNPRSGALVGNLETHQSDILCLAIGEGRIHAAGVDPRIISIKQIAANDFRVVQKRNGPARDVRAMACYDDKIYAAGEDYDIYVTKDGCQVLINQWNKLLFLGGSLRMTRGLFFVDLWTNGSSECANSAGDVVMKRQPVYFARIYCARKRPLVSCDLSNDGRLLAISTSDFTTVYQINVKGDQTIDLLQKFQTQTASALKIIGNSLFMTTSNFELWQISVNGGELKRILEQYGYGGVAQLAVSYCGHFVAVITTRSQVFVIDVKAKESRLLRVSLPIDVTFTDANSLFVLCATAGFGEPSASTKVLFEFPKCGGPVRRSASMVDLFGAPRYRAVSLISGPGDQVVVLASSGQWVLVNKSRSSVYGPVASLSAERSNFNAPKTLHFRSPKRICSCRSQASEPATAPFKLKKFGQQ